MGDNDGLASAVANAISVIGNDYIDTVFFHDAFCVAVLLPNFKEEIGRILFESLDFDDYDFDFNNANYEEIAEWASNI